MRTAWLAFALLMTFETVAPGQRPYWGLIGGTGLTPGLPRYAVSGPADVYGNPPYYFEHLPGSRSFILGGLVAVQLTRNFAIETEVLHRPLPAISIDTVFPSGGRSVSPQTNSWRRIRGNFP